MHSHSSSIASTYEMQAYSVLTNVHKSDPTHELERRHMHVQTVLLATRPTDTITVIVPCGCLNTSKAH